MLLKNEVRYATAPAWRKVLFLVVRWQHQQCSSILNLILRDIHQRLQIAALLGELGVTRTRATQAEAEKARAVAAAAASASAPQPAAPDDSKRLLGQLASLNDEVTTPSPPLLSYLITLSYPMQMARVRSSHAQVEAEAAALREEIAKYR